MIQDQNLHEQNIRRALSPIGALLDDRSITEIMVTPNGWVWIEKGGVIVKTEFVLTEPDRRMALIAIGKGSGGRGTDVEAGTEKALVSASVAGMRYAGAMCVDARGSSLTIRKHLPPELRPELNQLVQWGMLPQDLADLLVKLIIHERKNCVFAGPTSGGKTTLANAVLMRLPAHERICIIEDAREMAIRVENRHEYVTSPQSGITAASLVKLAMRERPDRLVLSETRGDDTYDLIRALSSGHNGSVTTLHASSARGALTTLELLLQMSLPPGVNLSENSIKGYIAGCINLIVYCSRIYIPCPDGSTKSTRQVTEVIAVNGLNTSNDYETKYLHGKNH